MQVYSLCISQFHLRPAPPPPIGLTPGNQHFFFALDRVRTKNEGKCPELCQHCNIFH